MDSLGTLRALSDIIAAAVTVVERKYKDVGIAPPSLDEPFKPHSPGETLRRDPAVADAAKNLVAAAGQIAACMRDPVVSVLNASHSFQISSCLRAAAELDIAEILRDAGPQGLHVDDIATPSQSDPKLIARILRLLATHHIFREVEIDVFANNRISSTLDKGKPVNVLYAKPQERLLETNGLSALVEFISDDTFKASSYLTDTILEPTAPPGPTPHMRAFRTSENMFQWFENPANKEKLTRFGIAMRGTAAEEPEDTMFNGFKWEELLAGSKIVDVGGGLGAHSLSIAKKYPQLRVVDQDRGPVIEQAKAYWKEKLPSHIEAGLVEFQAHDFLAPQPVKDAGVFLLRRVVHDWSDAIVISMLKHLRVAALPTTKLVIMDSIAAPAVPAGKATKYANSAVSAISILGLPSPAPEPLLHNFGMAGVPLYYYDITVHNLLGGMERTMEGFYDVLQQAGWKLVQVYHCPQTATCYIIGDPVQ
ncbi:O-methyltransferase [Mycena crocata]|nr:O-methyltransferase [Mycena crocata]